MAIDIHWIRDNESLAQFCAEWQQLPFVALDTEFMRVDTFYPIAGLLQIGDGKRAYLIDPLTINAWQPLAALLENPAVLKVLHACSEDLEVLLRLTGSLPAPLFDTQLAAAYLNLGFSMGYSRLVQEVLGIDLPKGETRSDWLRRPLSASQLEYAADDVRHLHAVHASLQQQLDTLGRSGWLAEDSARQLANAGNDQGERWPHLSMRSAQFLDAPAQRRLLRLLRWREAYARSSDRPRRWILDNELAVSLARANPVDPAALQAQLGATPKAPKSLRDPIWQALSTPLADENDAPLARGEDRDKKQLRAMQDAVLAAAGELGVPEGLLASRKLLEALQDGSGWTGALAGWRRDVLEARLQPLLAGATAT